MTAGVITVGGKKYAVGLYWQVSDTKGTARAAKAAATQSGFQSEFYCIRAGNAKGRFPQFGLADKDRGYKWNMPTAAASLANRQPGSWAGVFTVPEGVWFIEVRDDLIAPDGDILFADEAEAMGRLQETSAMGGLERIYAPSSWAIPGAESSSLASLLSNRAEARLLPVRVPKMVWFVSLGGIAVVLIALLLTFYILQKREDAELERMAQEAAQTAQQRMREEEERIRREEEARRQQMQQQVLDLPTYQRIWESQPNSVAWLEACRDAFDKVQLAPLGWSLSAASCVGNQVLASWTRTTGPAVVPEGGEVDPSLRSASARFSLKTLPPRGSEKLWPKQGINLYALHNDWLPGLSYLPDDKLPPLPNGQQVPPPPWQKRQIQWTVPVSPWNIRGPLVDLPGLIVERIVWSQGGTWQIEGVLYEQR